MHHVLYEQLVQASQEHRPLIMGIVNVTPDSFSDGGNHDTPDAAIAHGLKLLDDGAQILDIGGESTRPGFTPVTAQVELGRIIPVIQGLLQERPSTVISVDTYRSEVAAAALEAGAIIINDVTGGSHSPDMFDLIAANPSAYYVLMHDRTLDSTPTNSRRPSEAWELVASDLEAAVAQLLEVGANREQVILDPGIGFGKTMEENVDLLRDIEFMPQLGYPILLGTSRKRVIGMLSHVTEANKRDYGTAATTVFAALHGVAIVRVHNVAANRHTIDVAAPLC